MSAAAAKRKRSPSGSPARSRSPPREPSPPTNRRRSLSPPPRVKIDLPSVVDADHARRVERERQLAVRMAEAELEGPAAPPKFDAAAEFAKLASTRSGGVYMPPARLRALQAAAAQDKSSTEYQRLSWDALRKSITGIVNRVNISNIKNVVPELFAENLVRGRGLFARSIMKAQAASLPFTPVFAALVAIINTKLPQVGELVLIRLVSQFRRSFKRNDKIVCNATTMFIAHLVNQVVAHELIALQILVLLLEKPTDDSVEIAVSFMREAGAFLSENSPKAAAGVFERFRAVLHEGSIDKRVQYMIEVLMQVRKDKFKDNPIVPEGLDLVEEEDQITHRVSLDDELQVQEGLNLFKADPNYLDNEEKYGEIKAEILGESSDEESGSGNEESEEEDEAPVANKDGIEDRTETNLINLRRTIYLTIVNTLSFEEAVHKLMKVNIQDGQEIELCKMVVECCSQARSYDKFFGLIGERFCKIARVWCDCFEEAFREYYDTIHRYETNRLRNIARFFGHILATDAVSWNVLDVIKMNEDDTTSSSRIFVKIMFQEVMEQMGLKSLTERFKDADVKDCTRGMFPMDNPKNTRFAINYFTSIGLGAVTEDMREHLKNAPRLIMEQRRAALEAMSSSSDSDSDDSSDSDSDSDSESSSDRSEDSRRRTKRGGRGRSYSRSRSGRGMSGSRSPPRRRSPPPRHRDSPSSRRRDDSPSPPRRRGNSPPPRRKDGSPPRRRDDSPRRRRNSPPPPPPPRVGRGTSRSPRRKDDSPPPRRYRDDQPGGRRPSPPRGPPRRNGSPPPGPPRRSDSPPRDPPRRAASPPNRDSPPPRRPNSPPGRRPLSPPARRPSPPPRRPDSSPPRRRRGSTSPPARHHDDSPGRRRDRSPPRRRPDSRNRGRGSPGAGPSRSYRNERDRDSSRSRSPPPRGGRNRSDSGSPPPPRGGRYDRRGPSPRR